MSAIIGIDPGLRECGVGLVDAATGRALAGWLVHNPEEVDDGPSAVLAMARVTAQEVREKLAEAGLIGRPALLVVERQWIASHGPRRGGNASFPGQEDGKAVTTRNPGQILRLATVTGALMACVDAHKVVDVMPSTWKGGGKKGNKDRVNKQTWLLMSPTERAAAQDALKKTTGHNVKDGLGIAKWAWANYRRLMLQPAAVLQT